MSWSRHLTCVTRANISGLTVCVHVTALSSLLSKYRQATSSYWNWIFIKNILLNIKQFELKIYYENISKGIVILVEKVEFIKSKTPIPSYSLHPSEWLFLLIMHTPLYAFNTLLDCSLFLWEARHWIFDQYCINLYFLSIMIKGTKIIFFLILWMALILGLLTITTHLGRRENR